MRLTTVALSGERGRIVVRQKMIIQNDWKKARRVAVEDNEVRFDGCS